MILWAAVMAVVAAEPAQGSASGTFAFGDLSGSFVTNVPSPGEVRQSVASGTAAAIVGYGFDVGHVRLVPSLRGSFGGSGDLGRRPEVRFIPQLDLAFSATDLVNETHSGLRFSPVVGFSHGARFTGRWATETLVRAGFSLERRFGPVEVAWRAQGIHHFAAIDCGAEPCLLPQWESRRRSSSKAG